MLTVGLGTFLFLIGFKNEWWVHSSFDEFFNSLLSLYIYPNIPPDWQTSAVNANLGSFFTTGLFLIPSFIFLVFVLETYRDKKRLK